MGTPSSVKPSSAKPASAPLNANERQELIELRRKLRQVQMERDILAKATAWSDVGVLASRKRIAALMRTMHIQGVSRRRAWCVMTERNKRQRPAPDLVKRQFVAKDINQLRVADMTYVPTWEGFLYLAVVTDVYSRKVVGWAFGVRIQRIW